MSILNRCSCHYYLLIFIAFSFEASSSDKQIYLGSQLGYGSYYEDEALTRKEDSRLIGGLSIGYKSLPYLSAELNYQHLGKMDLEINEEKSHFDIDQVALLGKLSYPVTSKLEPFLKVGISNWFGHENKENVKGISPIISGGLQYSISDKFNLGMIYQYIDSIDVSSSIGHSSVLFELSYLIGSDNYSLDTEQEIEYIEYTNEVKPVKEIKFAEEKHSISFGFDSADISESTILNKIADTMKSNGKITATIYGYASPIGRKAYNHALSQNRADKVRHYLLTQGVAADLLFSQGKGEYYSTESPIEFGQRVDIILKE